MDNFKIIPDKVRAGTILFGSFEGWNKNKVTRVKKHGEKHSKKYYIDDRKYTVKDYEEYEVIPYKDISEFISLYPNATKVFDLNTYPRDYAPNPTFYSRIVGNHMGYIKIEFPYRYMDKNKKGWVSRISSKYRNSRNYNYVMGHRAREIWSEE